jgi:tetratricopeptide (TPR) repeat protein
LLFSFCLSEKHLSAERFDGTLQDIFDLQDEVTAGVVGAILPKLETAEIARATRKPTASLEAYDYYLRGMAAIYRWTGDSHDEAFRLFGRAIELDPDFATAYGVAARCYSWRAGDGRATDKIREADEAARLARRAVDPLPAISCLGASRTPAAAARGWHRHAGVRETCPKPEVGGRHSITSSRSWVNATHWMRWRRRSGYLDRPRPALMALKGGAWESVTDGDGSDAMKIRRYQGRVP